MTKKPNLSKPYPLIPTFNGPAHYARMAALREAQSEQSLVIDLAGEQYKLTLPGVIRLEKVGGGVIDPPIDPVEPGKGTFFGANTFIWVPLEKLTMFSSLRCYIDAGWIWRPNGIFVQPIFQAETEVAHGLDDYFAAAKARGIDILPCINRCPNWYAGPPEGVGSNNHPCIKSGRDRNDPQMWADYAEFWGQFVKRYGSKKHPDEALRVDTTPRWPGDTPNVKKSGLNLVRWVEIDNEKDAWWHGKESELYLKPEAHAAMLVAVMRAIEEADPNMKVVMAGLTGYDMPYLKTLVETIKKLGGKLPYALNLHHYSHLGNKKGVWPPTWWLSGACYPEEDADFLSVVDFVAYAKSLGCKLLQTEFGCDDKPDSWMHIDGKRYGVADELAQANLVAKTFRALKEFGLDGAYAFTSVNEPGSANGGLWLNCGAYTNQATGYQPKLAVGAIRKVIAEYAESS